MNELSEVMLGRMMLGTLVLNKEGKVERVQSMYFEDCVEENFFLSLGPRFVGKINGNPISDYKPLPVTVGLLYALGWKIKDFQENGLMYAWPPAYQFYNKKCADDFQVQFILKERAFEDWPVGSVIVNIGSDDWIELDDFVELERRFLELFSQRMAIQLDDEYYNAI